MDTENVVVTKQDRKYKTLVTDIGKEKMTNAILNGKKVNVVMAAVGDGGGSYYLPTADMTALVHEVWRGAIASKEINSKSSNMVDVKFVLPGTVGGFTAREAALIDDEGDMIAVCNLPDTEKAAIEDGIAASGAKKVYLMLGMNCIASGVDRVSQDLVTLVSKIQEKSPGIAVLIESVTPMTADSPRADGSLNNFTIQEFNEKMKAICQEKQWYYVNVAEAVTGDQGALKAEYSGDKAMGIHFNYDGAAAWANYLLTHVPEALK